jgi:hypothetical protein
MTLKRAGFSIAMLTLGFVLVACEHPKIGDINADPGRFINKEVVVTGTVVQSIGALGQGVYKIDDGTGQLWVWSNGRGVPSKGAKVGVKGLVTESVTFLGINYATVLRETDRRRG